MCLSSRVAHAQAGVEHCFVDKTNAERTQRGLAAMTVDTDLVAMARRHSQRMAGAGTIFHNPDLAAEGPPGWRLLGENVGVGGTCDSLHKAFMSSPHHRENILEPRFNFVGMGVVLSGSSTVYITEQFMEKGRAAPKPPAPRPPASPAPAASPRGPSPRPSPVAPSPSPPPPASPSQQLPAPPASAMSTPRVPGAGSPAAPGPSLPVLAGIVAAILAGAAAAWALVRRRE